MYFEQSSLPCQLMSHWMCHTSSMRIHTLLSPSHCTPADHAVDHLSVLLVSANQWIACHLHPINLQFASMLPWVSQHI